MLTMGGIQSPQAWPLSLDSTRLAADLPTLRLVQQKGCFHLPRVFTPHQSVSYQLPNEPHTSILKATFRAGDEEATLFCLVPDTVSWILQILSKDQAKGFLKSRKWYRWIYFQGRRRHSVSIPTLETDAGIEHGRGHSGEGERGIH